MISDISDPESLVDEEDRITQLAEKRRVFHRGEKHRKRRIDRAISAAVYTLNVSTAGLSVVAASDIVSTDAKAVVLLVVGVAVAVSTSLLGVQQSVGFRDGATRHSAAERVFSVYADAEALAPQPLAALAVVDKAVVLKNEQNFSR